MLTIFQSTLYSWSVMISDVVFVLFSCFFFSFCVFCSEAADIIDRMLTVDPDKRSTIAELRNHPWMLMEYTDLASQIEQQKPVTPEQVAEARQSCMAAGDEDVNQQQQQQTAGAQHNNPKSVGGKTDPITGHRPSSILPKSSSSGSPSSSKLSLPQEETKRQDGRNSVIKSSQNIQGMTGGGTTTGNNTNSSSHQTTIKPTTSTAIGTTGGNIRELNRHSSSGATGGTTTTNHTTTNASRAPRPSIFDKLAKSGIGGHKETKANGKS